MDTYQLNQMAGWLEKVMFLHNFHCAVSFLLTEQAIPLKTHLEEKK